MEMLIETCLTDFFIALMDKKKIIDYIHLPKFLKKSDQLPVAYEKLVNRNHQVDIDVFYVTNGPGSFMGVRAGLLFVVTMAQMTNAKIYIATSLAFISGGIPGDYYLDAKSSQAFHLNHKGEINLIKSDQRSFMDYDHFLTNPQKYLAVFKEVKPENIKAQYFKEPRIG